MKTTVHEKGNNGKLESDMVVGTRQGIESTKFEGSSYARKRHVAFLIFPNMTGLFLEQLYPSTWSMQF